MHEVVEVYSSSTSITLHIHSKEEEEEFYRQGKEGYEGDDEY